MKIAILGTRGIPARYGGFETLADQLSRRLVERGQAVTVYCRKPFTKPEDAFDPRVRRIILPTVSNKHFDTLFHTFISVLHVIFTDTEVVLICNVANSPFAWIPRLVGKPVALNVDGLDRKRRKWNIIGQWFLHFCEVLSALTPTGIVTDARAIQDYYWQRYRKQSDMIAYGAEPPETSNHLGDFGLSSRRYILYVARLEPENNPELVIRAYRSLETDWPLVIVGGNPYQPAYVRELQSLAGDRVIFTGSVYGDGYWTLQKNAGLFVFAGEIGGIHPALVEAMAAGNAILYLDTAANHETAQDSGISFHPDERDLATKLGQLITAPERVEELRQRAKGVASEVYRWEAVVDQYEALFVKMLGSANSASDSV
jgi:glycosyltransferase involved in cell wall biosynthesis